MAPVLRPEVGLPLAWVGGREGWGWLVPADANPDLQSNSPGGGVEPAGRPQHLCRECHHPWAFWGLRHQGLFLSSRQRNGSLLSDQGTGHKAATSPDRSPDSHHVSASGLSLHSAGLPGSPGSCPGQGPR